MSSCGVALAVVELRESSELADMTAAKCNTICRHASSLIGACYYADI